MDHRRRETFVRGMFTGLFVGIIASYQKIVSPFLPPSCIYTPTCSHYAVEAIRRYGPLKGVAMALGRLARCTPFHKGGVDPVK